MARGNWSVYKPKPRCRLCGKAIKSEKNARVFINRYGENIKAHLACGMAGGLTLNAGDTATPAQAEVPANAPPCA